MGIFNFTNPEQMVTDAATKVAGGVGNSFMNFIKSPFDGLAGMGQGLIGNIGGIIWGGIRNTAIIIGLKLLTPALWASGEKLVLGEEGAKKSGQKLAADNSALFLDSAKLGFGAEAAMSAAKGALGGGGILGGGLVLAGVTAVTIGAIAKNGIKVEPTDTAAKQPPATPAGTSPEKPAQAKG